MVQKTVIPERKTLAEVAAAESRRLINDPNLLSMGIGLKFVKGKPRLSAALQYYVREKASSHDLEKLGTTMIPGEVGGYPTDVIQVEIFRTLACPPDNPLADQRMLVRPLRIDGAGR